MSRPALLFLTLLLIALASRSVVAEPKPVPPADPDVEIVEPKLTMTVKLGGSKLFKAKKDMFRVSVTRPDVVTLNQYSAREFEVIGRSQGDSTMTIWFGKPGTENVELIRYLVKVEKKKKKE